MENFLEIATKKWGLSFAHVTKTQYQSSVCPFCGEGEDRFNIWIDKGNFWCRKCGQKGWIIDNKEQGLSPQELRIIILEGQKRRAEEEIRAKKARIEALEQLVREQAHLLYHQALTIRARDYWYNQGINDHSIEQWKLGYCQHTPLYYTVPSFTIPVINNGQLRNIRHRLDHNKAPRYLPHSKNLPHTLFGADRLINPRTNFVVIVEGEKKVIVLEQHGFPSVGVLGMQGFNLDWIKWFNPFDIVYVCYDMDAIGKGRKLAKKFGYRGRVVELPKGVNKPDDFFRVGGDTIEFNYFLKKAKVA